MSNAPETIPAADVLPQPERQSIAGTRYNQLVIVGFTALIAAVELASVFAGVTTAMLCYALLLPIFMSHFVYSDTGPYRTILTVFMAASLLRILSFLMPVAGIPPIYQYILVGVPFFITLGLVARLLQLSAAQLMLTVQAWRWQLLIGASGIPLSIIAFGFARPTSIVDDLNWSSITIAAITLCVFSGFMEELFFRGLTLAASEALLGRGSIVWSASLFSIMYIGTMSPLYLVFIAGYGLFSAWCVYRTRSILGVSIAHSIINIGMLIVWPYVFR